MSGRFSLLSPRIETGLSQSFPGAPGTNQLRHLRSLQEKTDTKENTDYRQLEYAIKPVSNFGFKSA
eukprot:m.34763 g.34763  ORF g.34763 m.34763 type:complete len:66 (+) comp32011_c0_seq3:159-356(+)